MTISHFKLIWKWCQFRFNLKELGYCIWIYKNNKYYNYVFKLEFYEFKRIYKSSELPTILNIGF